MATQVEALQSSILMAQKGEWVVVATDSLEQSLDLFNRTSEAVPQSMLEWVIAPHNQAKEIPKWGLYFKRTGNHIAGGRIVFVTMDRLHDLDLSCYPQRRLVFEPDFGDPSIVVRAFRRYLVDGMDGWILDRSDKKPEKRRLSRFRRV
jgi:hypothetical protein